MIKLKSIMKPHLIFVPFVVLGIICWLLPASIIGVSRKSELGVVSISLFVVWYFFIVLACLAARKVAGGLVWINRSDSGYSNTFYLILTVLSAIGTVATFQTLGSLDSIIASIRSQQVNSLKEALYSDYSAGFLTFRYTAALSAAIALYRMLILRRFSPIDYLNVLFVLMCAFISARIILVQSAFFFIFMIVNQYGLRQRRIRIGRVMGVFLIMLTFSVVVGFTYLRSAGTYKEELGIENPLLVTGVELSRYAAMPIQVTIGVGEIVAKSDAVERRSVRLIYLAPTFLHPEDMKSDNSGGVGEQWYLSRIDLPPTLTTNSAYAALIGYLSYWAFLFMPVICFSFAFIFFIFSGLGSLEARLLQGLVLYGFFEIWRLYLFSAGSFVYMFLLLVGFFVVQLSTGRIALKAKSVRRERSFSFKPERGNIVSRRPST